ncbi:unnamed protein product [Pleuronectes platessa]|uniref:Uncharacterized protein n=1 Tax=Pleuronectes platessa TaxID=8262 RepID=A0A9N7YR86_PLEPL|nr:unnamed protein product [Pleuronectes platessa]
MMRNPNESDYETSGQTTRSILTVPQSERMLKWQRLEWPHLVVEAGEWDRDPVEVVSVFALCLVGAGVVARAPPLPSSSSDRIRSTTGTNGRWKETWENELHSNFIPPATVAAGDT